MSGLFELLKNYKRGTEIIAEWVGLGGHPVDKETAQCRADICLTCDSNTQGIKLTESIAEAIKEQVALKNHIGLHVDGEKGLHTCEICQCANRLQIWCPTSLFAHHYSKEDFDKFPNHCWKKRHI